MAHPFSEQPLQDLLSVTASSAPAPGGGGIAALTAASAAALIEMVANLTIGKKGYEAVTPEMERLRREGEQLRLRCQQGIDNDAAAFEGVIAAVRISKEDAGRTEKVQQAFKMAAQIPFQLGTDIFHLLELAELAVRLGNKWAVTDGVIAAINTRAAMRSAFYSAKVNLRSIRDDQFVQTMNDAIDDMEKKAILLEDKIENAYLEKQ